MDLNTAALRVIRQRSGLSISALAELVETSQPHLSNIEAGKRRASEELVMRLAAELKIPVTAILLGPVPVKGGA